MSIPPDIPHPTPPVAESSTPIESMSIPPDIPHPTPPVAESSTPIEPNAGGAQPPAPRTRLQRFRSWRFAPVVEILVTIAVALALAESVQAAVVKPFVIPTASMEPTLTIGQRVLVNRLAYDFSSPHRGDIVVFHPPNSLTCAANVPASEPCPRSNSQPSSQYFVKRVIGLPGDRISISGGHPVINGKLLRNEPYITPCEGSGSGCSLPHAMTVPPGEYFMLGDNRGDSDDSRYWGPIPGSWIIGEVFATYWPLDRIGIF